MAKPHHIYAEVLEPRALNQFHDALKQEFVISGALMPDAHSGYSLPIGAVIATRDIVVPAWVGYDIGCGMCALPTSFDADDIRENSRVIFDEVCRRVPIGNSLRGTALPLDKNVSDLTRLGQGIYKSRKGALSLGTLGGGNHFIEIGASDTGQVWVIIHSGSRGVGHGLATEYMKLAANSDQPLEGHHGFHVDSNVGQDYINDLNWGLDFALENRKAMMKDIVASMATVCHGKADWDYLINRNHNHAVERDGLWIHRKGATHAEDGMMGVIPGNMRDGSFIVRGKGNADSLWSSSHGAGRVLSRSEAKEQISMGDFEKTMEGITARVTTKTRDESPAVYKSIFDVMHLQSHLVDVVTHVKPIINIKG
ncbi:RtcB family protein [Neptuniibacter sp. QD37_11]|uniref:RtcB family protein n=1 Tax=Neptuniibacter sp. QD37_11 TaxID=3398209 RepID=UPI0039F5A912